MKKWRKEKDEEENGKYTTLMLAYLVSKTQDSSSSSTKDQRHWNGLDMDAENGDNLKDETDASQHVGLMKKQRTSNPEANFI